MKPHSLKTNLQQNSIGVFDSGLGGLTVLKSLQDKLPHESFIYFGDTAHVPYGTKSEKNVKYYSEKITEFLIEQGVKLIVVACNTASSLASDHLRELFDIPIIGVIKPCVETAILSSHSKVIGVIGTQATITSNTYVHQFQNKSDNLTIIQKACPLFVPIIEEGWADSDIAHQVASVYLEDMKHPDMDTLVLGCTHYPIIEHTLQDVLGSGVNLVSSGNATAEFVHQYLLENNCLNCGDTNLQELFYVTDLPQKFDEIGSRFLGRQLTHVQSINLI